jgi:hypothetical protein
MSAAFLRQIRVTTWRPAPGPDSELGSYFGQPVPGSTVIEGVRVQFTVEKDDASTANTATVTFTNLAQRTRDELTVIPRRMILEAGYGGEFATLFVGDVTAAPKPTYSSTDIETELVGRDGGRAIKHARVSKSYRSPTTALAMAEDAIRAMGLSVPGDLAGYQELQAQYPYGTTFHGLASDRLTQILPPGFSWSIQNGRIVVSRADGSLDNEELVINAQAGMIGTPQITPPTKPGERMTLSVSCLLFPEIEPRRRIRVVSKRINGVFRVVSVRHGGDNMGGDMLTEVEATPA